MVEVVGKMGGGGWTECNILGVDVEGTSFPREINRRDVANPSMKMFEGTDNRIVGG